ncbi:hypothetical protein HID58_042497 [Brassica napus]|uniref:beta-ketoacyl-[acyl-carrier-protein] synthase I n=1 Tax=Brassica napus TaxID=3708 RepID=A0ABQ8BDW7_BRANA|nr:hypothetical protein HID58_042497 [Brassica napus]
MNEEHGLLLKQTKRQRLHLNPCSLFKVSNIIYLDSLIGVGLSYSKNKRFSEHQSTRKANTLHGFYRLKNKDNWKRDDVSSPLDDVQKKIRHAERFGVSVKLTEEEKRNSRAEMLKAIGDVGPVVDAGGIIASSSSPDLESVGEAIVLDGIVSSPLRRPHALKKQWEDLGSQIKNFDCSEFPTRIAGEIKSFSTEGWVAPKLSKRMDKFMLYLLTAGKKALADGGVTSDEVMAEFNKVKCGVLIGSVMGGMKVFNDAIVSAEDLLQEDESFLCTFRHNKHGDIWWEMELLILCSMVTETEAACKGKYYDDNGTYISDECSHKIGKVIDALGLIDPSNILEPCNVQASSMSHIAIGSLPVRKKMFRREWPLGILPSWSEFISTSDIPCLKSKIGRWELCANASKYQTDAGSISNSIEISLSAAIVLSFLVVDGWRQWMSNDQVAGYTRGYANNLTFLKIKGAGHFVPEVKPREALDFYRRFLAGEKIKTFLMFGPSFVITLITKHVFLIKFESSH